MADPIDDTPDDDIQAGEYVLGVLDTPERRAAEQRMETDPGFAAMVYRWMGYLAPFADEIAEIAPSPEVRTRLMARLFGDAQPAEQQGFWHSLMFWRGATIAFAGIAALLLGVLFVGQTAKPPAQTPTVLFASLSPPSVEGILSVKVDPATGLATIDVQDLDVDDLYTELWVIPTDGTPRSLGVFPADGGQVTLPEQVLEYIQAGVALAVSLEELPTGSATGQPSERIIAIGQVRSY